MKKAIITLLLALVSLAGLGQVRSGLDHCLRDEATGEWLIGLFDDYAIYDCEYWEYAEAGKGCYVLTKDGRRKEIRLKKNTVTIDDVKHRISVLTSKYLPDYPSKDETGWPKGLPAEEDSVTLRVCVNTNREKAGFVIFINRMFNDKQVKELSSMDTHGRFEVRMPVNGPAVMGIFNDSQHPLEHTFWRLLDVEGGDTLLVYIDDKNDRTCLMGGKYARLNNELSGSDFQPDFLRTDELNMDSTMVQQRHYMAVCEERMDSLHTSRAMLSHRFRIYYQDDMLNQFARPMLLKCC